MPPMATPSISQVNRWARLKSPCVLVLPFRVSRVHFTAMLHLRVYGPPRGAFVHCCPDEMSGLPLQQSSPYPRRPWGRRGPRRPRPSRVPLLLGLTRHLADAEDDEFRRLHRSDADLANHLSRVDDFRRVSLRVALHVERLFRRLAHQRSGVVDAEQEGADVAGDALPERLVVRLEHHPLGADLDRLLDNQEQAAEVDVAPRRIARNRPGPPDADAAVAHVPDAVDPARVQEVLL